MVLVVLSASGKRLSGVPTDSAAPQQFPNPAEQRRSDGAVAVHHRAPAGLEHDRRCVALRPGRVQRPLLAGHGFEHSRSVVLFADARASADAAVPHDGLVGVRSFPIGGLRTLLIALSVILGKMVGVCVFMEGLL